MDPRNERTTLVLTKIDKKYYENVDEILEYVKPYPYYFV